MSGNNDNRDAWIKEPGDRFDKNRPPDFKTGFFPIRGNEKHNTRKLGQSGEIFVGTWDWYFPDNAGYYKAFMRLSRGDTQ